MSRAAHEGRSWFEVNGVRCALGDHPPGTSLAEVLRDEHGQAEVKLACGEGACGACAILLDGQPVLSCLLPVQRAAGRSVVTAAGVAASSQGATIAEAFVEHGAFQCGFCTPGFVVAVAALLADDLPKGDGLDAHLRRQLGGHLCRCTGYTGIVRAVRALVEARGPQSPAAPRPRSEPARVR